VLASSLRVVPFAKGREITAATVEDSAPVIITIRREAIEECDPEPVVGLLDSYVAERLAHNRNRVQLEVAGYADDPRELYEILEIRQYFQALFRRYGGLFYWLDTESGELLFLCLMLYEPVWAEEGVTVSLSDLQSFLAAGYSGLNVFCHEHDLSADASHEAISRWVTHFLSS
jgi:hypothetical protein